MKRDLIEQLHHWKTHPRRKPLILRGARQVGKSWLVEKFSKSFDFFIALNLETKQAHRDIFADDISVDKIIERIQFITDTKIEAGRTLLFIDEIQESKQALRALRYFKEDFPELHVIAAGSLLDFTLEQIGVPVGRVQFMYVHPLSFGEFLTVQGKDDLRQSLTLNLIDPIIHNALLEQVKTYLWLGGMPDVVNTWLETKNINECMAVQDEIVQTYLMDIPKYAKLNNLEHIEKLFKAIPQQLGNKFIYKNVDPDIRSYLLKEALSCLSKVGIAHIVYHSGAQGLPLGAQINSRRFRVFGFDIGLIQRMLGFNPSTWLSTPVAVNHLGNSAEQFVAQEYIAYTAIYNPAELYYWHREKKTSNAEVDFLFIKDGVIYPAEVKSSSKGHLKSLHLFLSTHDHSNFGLKISEANYSKNDDLISIPFYLIEAWLKSK